MNVQYLSRTAAIAALTCLAGMILRWVSPALVPFSILPVMVLLSGIILGAKYGALAMTVYVVLGLFGLPVFANPPFGGLAYLAKPSFGFILGYIGAAYVVGKIYRPQKFWTAVLAVLMGLVVLYIVGLSYLYAMMRWVLHKPTSLSLVLAIGFLPFIVSDLIKAGIAAWVGNRVVRSRANLNKGD
ncbi:biotin transporter BioY [Desulfitobacterium metallireducens]|uniref:Biotin transporter n=1 Tax=Desulfitobacterium metallireducens DSM 15288 TaxID=871968 RepID=W0E9M3_9FIRM|nr:biotin transporter BioY [Desulfitobacterium metallireducens]AHF05746.1 BioY protein [Desulfitobacterium metallireducens DSM 15288]